MNTIKFSQFKSVRAGIATASLLLIGSAAFTLNPIRSAQAQALPSAKEAALTGDYTVDKAHSDVSFTVIHMALSKVHGHFADFDGKVTVVGKKIQDSSVEFTIKADSVNTDSTARDTHLKSDAFFDVAKYPEITFKSTRINKRKDGYAAAGKLTMHGVTKDVILPFTVAGPVTGMDKKPHIGVEVSFDLNRRDYGISYGPDAMVKDIVNVTIDLDLAKK